MTFSCYFSKPSYIACTFDIVVVIVCVSVTGMTADRTCVVSSNNPGQCQQLDVLFVGTSTGRVMKTWVEGNLPKVIAEDMSVGLGLWLFFVGYVW